MRKSSACFMMRPGVPGLSEHIRVVSIIGRYLEHSRIFWFRNGGEEEFYIGSADWMTRNLDRRVEAVAPIEDPALRSELMHVLQIMLSDNRQAWDLHSDGRYVQRRPEADEPQRSTHTLLMARAQALDPTSAHNLHVDGEPDTQGAPAEG